MKLNKKFNKNSMLKVEIEEKKLSQTKRTVGKKLKLIIH